jgi:rsbT co-antagonist protein RsbR
VRETGTSKFVAILKRHEHELLAAWIKLQLNAVTSRQDLITDRELHQQSHQFLTAFNQAIQSNDLDDIMTPPWAEVRAILQELSQSRARQGFSPSETATFIFSLKQPLLERLSQAYGADLEGLTHELWTCTTLLDKLGLYTTEIYQYAREAIIKRQQQELLELTTPVVKLWDNILALPLIGALDSARTQVVMENLLEMIVATGAAVAIIDITGVPIVDTLVAQHLLKTVAAARLMGAECIISGIRPQIAQTIVHLGVDLRDVVTKATLADALALALRQAHLRITPIS